MGRARTGEITPLDPQEDDPAHRGANRGSSGGGLSRGVKTVDLPFGERILTA